MKTDTHKYVARLKDEPIRGRTRFHTSEECSTLRETPGVTMQPVTDEIVDLLGLKLCSVCDRRETGGPAIDVLEGFFGEDWNEDPMEPRTAALHLVDYLREHNIHLTVRRVKDNGQVSD